MNLAVRVVHACMSGPVFKPFDTSDIVERNTLEGMAARWRGTVLIARVVVLLALPASCTAMMSKGVCRSSLSDRARSQAYELKKTVALFEAATGQLPDNLDALAKPLRDEGHVFIDPLMDKVPRDPWGKPYVLLKDTGTELPFVVLSGGPDGRLWTSDDVGSFP